MANLFGIGLVQFLGMQVSQLLEFFLEEEKLSHRSPLDDVLIFYLPGFVDGSDGAELGGQEKKEKAEYCN